MRLDQIISAASDVHSKNIDLHSDTLICSSDTKMENSPTDKAENIPKVIIPANDNKSMTKNAEKVHFSERREEKLDTVKSSENLMNLVKQCSVPLVHVKSPTHSSRHQEFSIKLINPMKNTGSAFKPYSKPESELNLDKFCISSFKSLKMTDEAINSIKSSKNNQATINNLETLDTEKSFLNKIQKSSNLVSSKKMPWESSSYIRNYVNFLKSDKGCCESGESAEISLQKFINGRATPSDNPKEEIKMGSEIEVSSEMEIDSGIEMSDIEPSTDLTVKNQLALETDTSIEMQDDCVQSDLDDDENNSSDDTNLRLEIDSEMEVKNVMEVAAEDSSEVNFLLCQYNDLNEEAINNTSPDADFDHNVESEQILDMPILTLDSFEDGEEITTTETRPNLADGLNIENEVSDYSELRKSTENAPTISQRDLPEISSKNKISMPPPLLRFEEEVLEQPPDPVEISFFSLDDENLVITSEQALNMFENNSMDTRSHYHGNNIYHNRSSDNYGNEINYSSSSSACEVNANDISDISKLLNIEEKTIKEISDIDGNILNGYTQQYDYMNAPPFSNIEEIVTMDSSQNSPVDSNIVPTASSEVEILTSDANEPKYTDLAPASAKTVIETSSAVSEALQTLVGNIDFDSPSGSIDSPYGCSSGPTVGTTVDANGQFVVQVMGSGINMSIPNQYFNQMQENTDPNGLLETISEMDIMDILNIDYKNENSSYQPNGVNEEEVVTSNPLSEEYNYPSSSTDVEQKSPTEEKQPRTDPPIKRKQRDFESKKRPCSPKKKKCHSSVIAALRESIFRSKARKIVNQLGKDTETIDDLTVEDNMNDGIMDLNQNYHEKDIDNMVDEIEDFERPYNSSYGNNDDQMENPPYNYESDHSGYRSHHHPGHYNEQRDYSCCPSPNPEHCSTSAEDTRHHYRKHHHKYDRPYKSYSKSYHQSRCQSKCCSNRPSYPTRDMHYKRRRSHSPPLSSRNVRPPYKPSASSSCCSKCKHDNGSSSDSNNVPVMMLRPEELSSMMKKVDGKDGPMVVMPSETINNTDGDPLKVQLVYLVYPMDGQRMSADTLCHSFQKSNRDLPKSPSCGVSCSSNYHDQFPSPHSSSSNSHQLSPPNCRNKDGIWPDNEVPIPRHSHETPPHQKPLRQPSQQCYPDDCAEDPEGYLRKPIDSWTYADVVFFLMEACKEIRIDPNEVQFKSTDNGAALLQMSPGDFEVLASNNGQKLYDYFIKFKTQHYMISESQNVRPSYNNYGEHYSMLHPEPYSPCEDHHNNLPPPPGFPDHYHGYPEYHNHRGSPYGSPSSYNHPPESPCQEYVPQGAQYTNGHDQHHVFHSSDDRNGRYHEAPSAAGKTFPPLHKYDDAESDPDESEDEKPPEPPKKRGPGRPPKPENERKRKAKKTGRLWEFIRNLLLDPKTCPSLVRWEDHTEGVFRIVQSDVIANKWGMRKNNEKMNYEKLSRAMRYYYKAKIFEPVLGKRLVYKFGAHAKGWRPLNPNNPNFQNAY